MKYLFVFLCLGVLPLFAVGLRVWLAFRSLRKEASEHEAFAIRKPSLSPAERKQWNQEFLRWRFFRVLFWLGLGEVILLALTLQKLSQLPALFALVLVCQFIPFGLVYGLHRHLLFQYGRFNLQRFDPSQNATRQLAVLHVTLGAWIPILVTWTFLHFAS